MLLLLLDHGRSLIGYLLHALHETALREVLTVGHRETWRNTLPLHSHLALAGGCGQSSLFKGSLNVAVV